MRLGFGFAAIGLVVLALFSLYVRFAPSVASEWHVDPRRIDKLPAAGSYMLRDGGGDGPAALFDDPPAEVMARLDAVIRATPRVELIAGSVEDLHATYVARSALFGFPDYISVVAYPVDGGTAVAIWSRLRFGSADLGVNRNRVERWLEAVV